MIKTIAAAGALAAALAGCGGGGQSGPPSIASAAAQAGCTSVHDISVEMFAHQTASCTYHGQHAEIATFSTAEAQKNWEKVAAQFGAIVQHGDGWALSEY
jgi:hypothetical protein